MDSTGMRLFLTRQGLSPKTVNSLMNYCQAITRECQPLSEETFNTFLVKKLKSNSHASVNKYIQAIKKYCEFTNCEWGLKYKKLKEKPQTRIMFSDDEIMRFLRIKTRFSVFWKICAFTGCRMGEILNIEDTDVDLISKSITFKYSKTGRGRIVPISNIIFKDVEEYVSKRSGKLFPYSDTMYRLDFYERLKEMGISKHVKPYSLRHSFATRLLTESDAGLFQVQDILGHTDPKTTRQYYHGNINVLHKTIRNDPLSKKSLTEDQQLEMLISDVEKLLKSTGSTFSIEVKKNKKSFNLLVELD